MSRIKLIIIGVLCLACAAVNAPRLIEQFRGETPPLEDDSESEASQPLSTASIGSALFCNGTSTSAAPTSRPLPAAASASPSREAEPKSGAQSLIQTMNGLTNKLAAPTPADSAAGAPAKRRSPFAYAERGALSPPVDDSERRRLAAAAAESARKEAAEEKARLERNTRLDADEAALRKLKIHAIVSSKKGGVARIAGYNLRVGAAIPGHRGVIQAIRQDAVDVQLEDRVVRLYLVEPTYESADGAAAPAQAVEEGDRIAPSPNRPSTPEPASESRPALVEKTDGGAVSKSSEPPSSRPVVKVEGGTWTKGD